MLTFIESNDVLGGQPAQAVFDAIGVHGIVSQAYPHTDVGLRNSASHSWLGSAIPVGSNP